LDRRKLKFLLIGTGVVATMVFLLVVTMKSSEGFSYYVTVSEYRTNGASHGDKFRINGKVADGTIERAKTGEDVGFVMTDGGATLPVRYHGIVPDTFVDGADVVVEGAMDASGTFQAHVLLAKCPSKYEAAEKAGEKHPGTASPGSPGGV
jgi:cytochrome c-type biogenesis protein CcmE